MKYILIKLTKNNIKIKFKERGEGIKQKKIIDTDNSMVIIRWEGDRGRQESTKRGLTVTEGYLTLVANSQYNIQMMYHRIVYLNAI